jgi:hypothetical protein
MRTDVLEFLNKKAEARRARLIFALDATGSRQLTWDMACTLQAEMFREAVNAGSLDVQLVYYRGIDGFDGECRASRWMAPAQLTAMMQKIDCRTGQTQIGKVLDHVRKEAIEAGIGALVFVGDAMEENSDSLVARAGGMGAPAFMFQEGHDPIAERAFKAIAFASHGAYCKFDAGAARQLSELLKAVVAFVLGGTAALEQRNDAGSIKLLGQLKK